MRVPVCIERGELKGFATSNPRTPDPRIRGELSAMKFSRRSAIARVRRCLLSFLRCRCLVRRDRVMCQRERALVKAVGVSRWPQS
jgi:hypothetical protein